MCQLTDARCSDSAFVRPSSSFTRSNCTQSYARCAIPSSRNAAGHRRPRVARCIPILQQLALLLELLRIVLRQLLVCRLLLLLPNRRNALQNCAQTRIAKLYNTYVGLSNLHAVEDKTVLTRARRQYWVHNLMLAEKALIQSTTIIYSRVACEAVTTAHRPVTGVQIRVAALINETAAPAPLHSFFDGHQL